MVNLRNEDPEPIKIFLTEKREWFHAENIETNKKVVKSREHVRQIGTRFFHKKHSEACEVSVFPCNPRLFQGFGQNKSMFLIVVFLIGKRVYVLAAHTGILT